MKMYCAYKCAYGLAAGELYWPHLAAPRTSEFAALFRFARRASVRQSGLIIRRSLVRIQAGPLARIAFERADLNRTPNESRLPAADRVVVHRCKEGLRDELEEGSTNARTDSDRHRCGRRGRGSEPGEARGRPRVSCGGSAVRRRTRRGERPRRSAQHVELRRCDRHSLLLARAVRAGVQPGRATHVRNRRCQADDRDRGLVRLADDRGRPACIRPDVLEPACGLRDPCRPGDRNRPAADDHPARGRGAAVRSDERRHGRLGAGDDARRRVGARDGAPREDPARRDAGQRDRGRPGLPGDRQGRELRDRQPSGERHLPELRRDGGDVPQPAVALRPPERVQERAEAQRDGARGIRRRRLDRLPAEPGGPLYHAGEQLALERPARHERRRDSDEPRRPGKPPLAGRRLERLADRDPGSRRRRPEPRLRPARLPGRRAVGRRPGARHARHQPERGRRRRRLGLLHVRQCDVPLPHLRRDECGGPGVRGHRRDGRPAGASAPRLAQPGALRPRQPQRQGRRLATASASARATATKAVASSTSRRATTTSARS